MGVCLNLKGNLPSFASQWVNRGTRDCGDILKMPAVQNNNLKCGECGLWESLTVKGLEDSNREEMLEYLKTHECEPGTVVYKRHLKANAAESFALPFGVKKSQLPEGCKMYAITWKDLKFYKDGPYITIVPIEESSANIPFLVKTLQDVDLQITNCETTKLISSSVEYQLGSATHVQEHSSFRYGVMFAKGFKVTYKISLLACYEKTDEIKRETVDGGYTIIMGLGARLEETTKSPFRAILRYEVTMSGADANCVMMYGPEITNKLYCIDISRANKFWSNSDVGDPANVIGETTEWTAEVIWQDIPARAISFCDAAGANLSDSWDGVGLTNALWVKNTGSTPGNVVIGLRKRRSPEYLWSWHLWITEEPKLIGGFMDRNLGATSAAPSDGAKTRGLYYQFGRKDPFTGDMDRYGIRGTPIGKTTIDDGNVTFAKAVQTPEVFYNFKNSPTYDWASPNNFNSNDWNAIVAGKSLFDPSPKGWRLPTKDEYSNFSDTTFTWDAINSGRAYKGNWFPAAGRRASNDGSLDGVGGSGYYWSSSPYGEDFSYYLDFYSGYVDPSGNDDRAYGLSVRCVPE